MIQLTFDALFYSVFSKRDVALTLPRPPDRAFGTTGLLYNCFFRGARRFSN